MKIIKLLLLIISPVLVKAQSGSFIINGTINQIRNSQKVYLSYHVPGKTVRDSAVINNGSFTFNGMITDPVFVRLSIGLKSPVTDITHFYIEKGTITVQSTDSLDKTVLPGSKINDDNKKYQEVLSSSDKEVSEFRVKYGRISGDKQKDKLFMDEFNARRSEIVKKRAKLQESFIKNNPDSFLSLVALQDIIFNAINLNVDFIASRYDGLSVNIRKTNLGKQILGKIEGLRAGAVGSVAPDFTQNDVNGKPVSLKDFRGSYVFLDFWASWCEPCRAENPNVLKAFKQYKTRNFTVLGVSLDAEGSKRAWLKAIKTDSIAWTQVSNLKGWKNEAAKKYGISTIPMNFLIDPTGKIIGKNLRGDELNKKLSTLFN